MAELEGMPLDPGVPTLIVDEAGVGVALIVDQDGETRPYRMIRLYLEEGPIDLVMSEAVGHMVAGLLVQPLEDCPAVVDGSLAA